MKTEIQVTTEVSEGIQTSVFYKSFAKFQPEKYDVNLYKGFPMKRMAQIHQIFMASSSW
jgi:hypothetical protein